MALSKNKLRPFEWLTSPESLQPVLERWISLRENEPEVRVLHVGCGSSRLGEWIAGKECVSQVVNVDCDKELLDELRRNNKNSKIEYREVDFSQEQLPETADAAFDVIVDKSTLDCLLCTDRAAAGLLSEIYRCLKPNGAYVCISFHHQNFLEPLLQLPGAEWTIETAQLKRQVEDVISKQSEKTCEMSTSLGDSATEPTQGLPSEGRFSDDNATSAWGSGNFHPDNQYHRYVQVLVCQKHSHGVIDYEAVYEHIHGVNNRWYVEQNPMMTERRQEEILQAFQDNELDLPDAYETLFTDAEREHLEYQGFLQDWEAFLESNPNIDCRDTMTKTVALEFLEFSQ